MLALATIFYLTVGTVSNRRHNTEKSLSENLPHREFWGNFFDLAHDGALFSLQKFRSLRSRLTGGSGNGYETVES
jgi:hypothetical protein